MPYEILEHTADLRLKVRNKTPDGLFADAMSGMMRVLKQKLPKRLERKRTIALEAPDRTSLLVDFLNGVLALAHTYKEIYTAAKFQKLDDCSLRAELRGTPVRNFDEDIKAVTYHEADVKQNASGQWETVLVFDI